MTTDTVFDPRENEPIAVQTLRASMGGPLFLLGVIACTLSFLLSVAQLVVTAMYGFNSLYYLLYSVSGGYITRDIVSAANTSTLVLGGFQLLFSLVIVIGLWCAFGAAHGRKSPMGTGGLSAVRGIVITYVVFISIGAGLTALLLILGLIGLAGSSLAGMKISVSPSVDAIFGSVWVVYLLLALVCIVYFVLSICYYAAASGTLAKLKYTARTGRPGAPVSMFLIVMNYIGVVFGIVGLFFSLFTNALTLSGLLQLAVSLFSIVGTLLLTISLTVYRAQIGSMRIQEGYAADADSPEAWGAAPVYEEPAPAPQEPAPAPAPAPAPVAPVNVQVSMFSSPMMPMQPMSNAPEQKVVITPQASPAPAVEPVAGTYTNTSAYSVTEPLLRPDEPAVSGTPTSGTPVSGTPVSGDPVYYTAVETNPQPTKLEVQPTPPEAPAKLIRFCPECGASLPENAVFCSNCGHKL